jgi:hypothetical protein
MNQRTVAPDCPNYPECALALPLPLSMTHKCSGESDGGFFMNHRRVGVRENFQR